MYCVFIDCDLQVALLVVSTSYCRCRFVSAERAQSGIYLFREQIFVQVLCPLFYQLPDDEDTGRQLLSKRVQFIIDRVLKKNEKEVVNYKRMEVSDTKCKIMIL